MGGIKQSRTVHIYANGETFSHVNNFRQHFRRVEINKNTERNSSRKHRSIETERNSQVNERTPKQKNRLEIEKVFFSAKVLSEYTFVRIWVSV